MAGLSALPGRDKERALLARAVDGLCAGHGAVLDLAADPGLGKTGLLHLLARLAADRGATVLRARAEGPDAKPYQVYRDALGGDVPPPGSADGIPWDTGADRDLLRALRDRCADPAGTVLLLDDFHHCDPASARLTERLLGEPPPDRLLLVLAHRPRQTPPALLAALDAAKQTGAVLRVEPAPLTAAAVAALLPAADEHRAERLHAASGGNPRILHLLLAAGPDPDDWPERSDAAAGPLLRAAAPLIAELDTLPPAVADVLAAAAVLGEPFRLGDVARVAGEHTDRTADALAELGRADLVRSLGPGRDLAFRHPALGRLVHHRLNPGLRLNAHRRALALLEARGAPAAARARHAEQLLLGGGPAEAVPVLVEGAAEVVVRSPATAARWLRAALESAPADTHDARTRVALALDRCRALTAAGRLEQARALGHEILRTPGGLPEPLDVQALAVCVGVERLLGRYAEADAMARTVVDRLPRPLPAPLPAATADLVLDYGLLHAVRGTAAEVRALAHEGAAAAAATPGAEDGRTALRVLAAFCDSYAGDFALAAPEVERCGRLVDARPDTVAGRAPDVLALLGCAELYVERFTDAHRHLSRGLATASGGAHKHLAVNHLLGLSILDQWAGRLDLAQRHAREAERLGTEIGAPDVVGLAMAMRASALLWAAPRRRTAEVVALAEQGLRRTVPGSGWWAGSAVGLLAQARLVGGDPAACLRTLLEESGGEDLHLLQPAAHPSLFALMTTAALLCGDLDTARRSARAADAAAERLGRLPFQQSQADRAAAAMAFVDGDPARAAELALGAARVLRGLRMPVQYAWTVIAAAPVLAQAHGPAAALGELDEALDAARACGALRLCEDGARVRAALTSGGAGGSPADPVPDPSEPAALLGSLLSAREREVAELAADGLPSRRIAERLVLSPRTVDTHLGSIYRKLGVSSRSALARLLHGPGDPAGRDPIR
ncbi:AAA ATPase domain-containing protein [Streptomyces sp. TLI_053]|uniref:helix-turn-helix transcriptional regulator n=1 Tax=Streptomyces sp. TLI_053 TaxID=1855352 RepID=UPI0008798E30|nr:LuxR family transcriptional regulator [Streptomyces sp. TLI_053]SDT80517.1 AAA ATPase domain-containing protein [Streptomyces sp. TLI_053]